MYNWSPRFEFQHPPGTYEQFLKHPHDSEKQSAVGITHEHRFAFYFWGRWLNRIQWLDNVTRPDLITIDWHRDLAVPTDQEKKDLDSLDISNSNELSLFCWGYLNPHNDDHVLSAAYKNLIGDIYVVCKQKFTNVDRIIDIHGNSHKIHVLNNLSEVASIIPDNNFFLDLDLDYFTETDSFMGMDADLELASEDEVRNIVDPHSTFFKKVSRQMAGMSIALEPKFCGGYRNSSYLFDIVDDQLFDPPLLHPEANWKL